MITPLSPCTSNRFYTHHTVTESRTQRKMTDPNKGAKITLYWYAPLISIPLSSPRTAPHRTATNPPESRLAQSRSHRILWLLEALHLTYELKIYHRGADKLAPRELKEIHPLGKSPVLTVQPAAAAVSGQEGDGNSKKPIVLAESGLIIEYLLDHYGANADAPLIPERYAAAATETVGGETDSWLRYRYYMHYAEGSLMPFLVMQLVMDSACPLPPPPWIEDTGGSFVGGVLF